MLPTFVIGLREGLEASLIVGIIAAFIKQRSLDPRSAFRSMWAGVSLAVSLCASVGIGLHVFERNLPQRQQEQLETIIGLVAAAMVTWMIFWIRSHARSLRSELESRTAEAIAAGSLRALVVMAFLAVLREGFETAVFLVAAFQNADRPSVAGGGALLGIVVAIVIGFGVYRGGVRINLNKFFKFTGLALVIVAAGLVSLAAHTAHEAGWINVLQNQAIDLSSIIKPGGISSAMFTGMLGILPRPTVAEVIAWFAYAVPMLWVVLRSNPTSPRSGIGDRESDVSTIKPNLVSSSVARQVTTH